MNDIKQHIKGPYSSRLWQDYDDYVHPGIRFELRGSMGEPFKVLDIRNAIVDSLRGYE